MNDLDCDHSSSTTPATTCQTKWGAGLDSETLHSSSSMWRPIISEILFQLSTWLMKLARVSGERQLQRCCDTDMEHASPAHSSSTQSIRHFSASAETSLDEHSCCTYFVPTVESLPAVAQSNLQSRRKAFRQHKRLWRIARRICPIYAAFSLHSSQKQRLHQTKAAQISQCHPNS